MTSLNTIEKFFDDYDFKGRKVTISHCEKVIDCKRFIDTNIRILKNNSGNKLFLPYYERINKLYKILKSEL